jgi:tRNA threonylcarbamoyladenosine biosynthesis protein TsaE
MAARIGGPALYRALLWCGVFSYQKCANIQVINSMKYVSKNLEETQKIANDFVAGLLPSDKGATVVGLYGDLGAGKTAFTQSLAKVFGVEEVVTSPTFVIMKVYPVIADSNFVIRNSCFDHLIHIDAYRLEKSEELLHLGWREIILDHKNIILIEWPERVENIMPEHIRINLTAISENSREIEILK